MRETADISAGPRQAVIDIGSNTVRLVIYGGAPRAPVVVWNEKVTARLGSDLSATRTLSADAMDIALAGLRRYRILLNQLGVRDITVLATAAVREAENGPDFVTAAEAIGFAVDVVSGEREAALAAAGVRGAFPGATGLAADLGGGSIELVPLSGGNAGPGASLPLGTLRLAAMADQGRDAVRAKVDKKLGKAGLDVPKGGTLYLVGGTFRAFATWVLAQQDCPIDDPHGLSLDAASARKYARKLEKADPDKLAQVPNVSSMRAAKLPDAALLLNQLIQRYEPAELVVSAWGLREGLLFERLDPLMQSQDPLLTGVTTYASPRGGSASLAVRIAAWTAAARSAEWHGDERLRIAATQLALASMSVDPNLRLAQSLNLALHKRWIGLDFAGRAMIAATLAANCGAPVPSEVEGLASPAALAEAAAWGMAMRLFRRLGGNALAALDTTVLHNDGQQLILAIAEECAALCNEGVERDLGKLAAALTLEPVIRFLPQKELRDFASGET